MPLRLAVNGEERLVEDLASGATLGDFIATLSFRPDRIAVEHNGEIVPRTEWAGTALADGDKLEVVHFVGGGTLCAVQR